MENQILKSISFVCKLALDEKEEEASCDACKKTIVVVLKQKN
jgi:hypothetical protein